MTAGLGRSAGRAIPFLLSFFLCLGRGEAATGMASLRIVAGVREAGMGGAGVAAGTGAQAITLNPAASATVKDFGVSASYTSWLLDASQQSVTAVRNLDFVSLGFGITGFSAGKFEYRSDVPTQEPIGTFLPFEHSLRVNVSRLIENIIGAGMSVRYYHSKVFDRQTSGFGCDLGIRITPLKQLTVGLSLLDFGWNLSYFYERFRLPTRSVLGVTLGQALNDQLSVNLAADAGMGVYTRDFELRGGAELEWQRLVSCRLGYEFLEGIGRPAFGLGIRKGIVQLDYALSSLNSNLGMAHKFGVELFH